MKDEEGKESITVQDPRWV